MINSLKPSNKTGHDAQRGEILDRINKEYGPQEEKAREAVKKLGKDEFFKILINQIQHQDPLKPYQNEQMAAQMAQFTALEQMVNVNQNLEKLTQAQQPIQHLNASHLIGKYITADSSRVLHTEGKSTEIGFELPSDVSGVKVTLMNDRGENIREIERNNLKQGVVKVTWDGKQSNSSVAKSGQYLAHISAWTAEGKPIQVQTQRTERVHGVAFDGKETILLTGDILNPQKMLLKNVYKVVEQVESASRQAMPSSEENSIEGK